MSKFDFNKIEDFDEHINLSIPNYEGLINQIVKFSDYFVDEHTNVYDLGCSTGKMFKMLELIDSANYIGVDNSKLLPDESFVDNVSFVDADLLKYNDRLAFLALEAESQHD